MYESTIHARLKEPVHRADSLSNDTSLACCEVADANESDIVKNRSCLITYCVTVVILNDCRVIFNTCRIVCSSPRRCGYTGSDAVTSIRSINASRRGCKAEIQLASY